MARQARQDLADRPGLRDASAWREWRVAVEDFGERAQAVGADLFS